MHKMEIVLASANPGKVKELKALLGEEFNIVSLKDIGIEEELAEDFDNLEDNAIQKAMFVFQQSGKNCLAEDTGLFVDALNGEPGVYSARYAGPEKDPEANMALLLNKMEGIEQRTAHFKTVVALVLEGKIHLFSGVLDGYIAQEKKGNKGFGYDPVFCLNNGTSLAELNTDEKSSVSHRGKAMKIVINFLKTKN